MSEIIEFGKWLTGHDEATIQQMYDDYHKNASPSPPEAVGANSTTAAGELAQFTLAIYDLYNSDRLKFEWDEFDNHGDTDEWFEKAKAAATGILLHERKSEAVVGEAPDPIVDFARRLARVMKEQRSSTVIFLMQQAFPDDVDGLDQPSTDDILDNIITLTAQKNLSSPNTEKEK